MIEELDIPAPTGGLNKNWPVADQPPRTFREGQNVRPTNERTGRLQLSVRSGMKSWFTSTPTYVAGQGNKIQHLATATYQSRHIKYEVDPDPDEQWSVVFQSGATISRIEAGLRDDFFFVDNKTSLVRLNRYGVEISRTPLEFAVGANTVNPILRGHNIEVVGVDEEDGVYVATSSGTTFAQEDIDASHLFRFVPDVLDPNKYVVDWVKNPAGGTIANVIYVVRVQSFAGRAYFAYQANLGTSAVGRMDFDGTIIPGLGTNDSLFTIKNTGAGVSAGGTAPHIFTGGDSIYVRDMALRTNTALEFVLCGSNVTGVGAGKHFLIKATQTSATDEWEVINAYRVLNDETTAVGPIGGGPAVVRGAVGYACKLNSIGSVISMGRSNVNDDLGGAGRSWIRYVIDDGSGWISATGGAWERKISTDLASAELNYGYPGPKIDANGFIFAPTCRNSSGVRAVRVLNAAGTLLTSISHQEGSPPSPVTNECRGVALASTLPAYQADDTNKLAEIVAVCGTPVDTLTSTGNASVHGYRVISAPPVTGTSPRATVAVGVAAGAVYRLPTTGPVLPTNLTGRTPPLAPTAKFITSAYLFGKLYFTDGSDYVVYDPQPTNANPNGTLTNLTASGLGIVPPRARLIAAWRGRLVLARFADDPHNWFMSALGDPTDWDLFPSTDPIATQAVAGNASQIGVVPDIVNALIPFSDDFLVIGGDKSVWWMAGDPMAGGSINLVSDITGIAFGSPWTKDPEGRIYFFGSRGGIYVMDPSGGVTWLTRDTIERDLADIDLGMNYVRLAWNARENGLHVFVVPYGNGGTHLTHYFWSQKANAWFPDKFGSSTVTSVQPTSVVVMDGDLTGDRVMLLGTEDGRVLKWDATSILDDTTAIDARVLIGPLAPKETDREARFQSPSVVLARAGGGCHMRFFVSPDDSLPASPIATWRLNPGRNPYLPMRGTGSYCYAELRSTSQPGTTLGGERWAVESLKVGVAMAGRKRART